MEGERATVENRRLPAEPVRVGCRTSLLRFELRLPHRATPEQQAALAQAAYEVLVSLFPVRKPSFDGEYHFNETWLGGQWIAGLCLFQNSFGQFSEYLFGGLQWRPIEDNQPFYVKLTAGPLHGYSGQYRDKLPLNSSGVAPAIIPGVGYCVKRYCAEFVLLGTNAALLTFGMSVP